MNKQKTVKTGIVWSFIEGFGIKIISTLVFFILAKLLGATHFGLVAIATAFIDFGNVLVEQGMVAALVQKEKLERAHLDTAFWINIGLGASVFAILCLSAPFIADIYKEPSLTPVLQTSGLVFLIGPSGLVQVAQLTREMNFKLIARIRIVGLLAAAVVSLTMAFMGYGVWALVFQKLVFMGLSTVLFWFWTKWIPRLSFSIDHFRELFPFSYKMMINNFLTYFSRNSIELLIGFFHGTEAVGIYSFCYKVFQSTIETANTSVNKVMLPLFSSVQDDKAQLTKYFYKAIESSFTLLLPVLALIVFLSPEAILYFFNATWAESADLLKLVSIGGTIYMIYYYTNTLWISTGRPDLVVRFTLINVVINLALLAAVSKLPLIYVGYISIVRSLLLLPVAYVLSLKTAPISIQGSLQHLSRPFWMGGVTFLILAISSAVIPVLSPEWIWFAIQGVIWSITVFVALYFLLPSVLTPVFNSVSRVYLRVSGSRKV
ncbi:lipopolysaccharide biosynthesis protein [Cytophagaceae bacterium YF14B1]|uniref:Lipopolysaccharide biosynthesis protein n=1 Tax=Xanthocytophaga flava TaxID=3048013 RepID=A0AAE3QT67_9BACT|nr:lipopolysaccharide biosynthesis protein [Xanthocytophaga flavus]MDJ1484992.1 lipopolysaccharide biosynthesis protein [Xanthocytophaga flavus]